MPEQQQRTQNEGGIVPLSFETFAGVNTATQRTGVPDQQAYWLDGFIPLAQRRLRTLPGIGSSTYTGAANSIVAFYFYNIGATPYMAVFKADGSLIQVNTATNVATTILTAGSILSPSIKGMGTSQYGQQYLLAVANQKNGYWVWDGSVLYTAGTLSPNVILTNTGAGYYGAQPTITTTGGHGSGAAFVATLSGGAITNVTITNPGSGYQPGDSVSLVFTGGTTSGSGATVSASLVSLSGGSGGSIGALWSVNTGFPGSPAFIPTPSIAAVGSGYGPLLAASFVTVGANINWNGGNPPGVAPAETGGTLSGVSLVPVAGNPSNTLLDHNAVGTPAQNAVAGGAGSLITIGSGASGLVSVGYFAFDQTAPTSIPVRTSVVAAATTLVTLSQAIALPGVNIGDGLFFAAQADFPAINVTDSGYFSVGSVSVISQGHSYGPNASISVSGGGSPFSEAILTPMLSATSIGSVTSVFINFGGIYGSNTPPTLTVTDTAISAAGLLSLMPFGIQGTAVQTYAGHVWVFNGKLFQFSAPGSVSDFATADGGGSTTPNVSYLKVGYTGAVSANGFLFLLGDSSMDYISGVVTSGSVATTTFQQNNSDPEIGTPYPATITTMGTEIFVANATGVFVSAGGTFTKISEMMDGVYNSVPATQFNANPFSGFQLSSAKATIFGKRLWVVLVPIIDPVSGLQVNKLIMVRDKKIWSVSQQDVALTFIQGQEINSIFTAYGTDGTHIYPLFNQPSSGFVKTAQSRLWDDPGGIEYNKADSRFWSTWFCNSTVSTSISLTVDSIGIGAAGQYTSSSGYSIAGPTATGYFNSLPQGVGQQGLFTGMTIQTQAADMELIVAKLATEVVSEQT